MRQTYGNEIRHSSKIILVVLVGFLLVTGLCILHFWDTHRSASEPQEPTLGNGELEHEGVIYRRRKGIETVLVMGIDKPGKVESDPEAYRNDRQADFLMLLVIDKTQGSCTALHINRDTMAKVTMLGFGNKKIGTVNTQIALAHTYGSGGTDSTLNTVLAVSDLLHGLSIDYYVSLTMDAVGILNDLVGGVTVTMLEDFTELDSSMKEGEEVTLQGDQALLYVRERFELDDSTNLSRMERQRQYLGALYEKTMASLTEDPHAFVTEAATALTGYMLTDCTAEKLDHVFDAVTEYGTGEIQTLKGESTRGEEFMEFTVDPVALKQQVLDLFYEVKPKQ